MTPRRYAIGFLCAFGLASTAIGGPREILIDRYYHSGEWEKVEKLLRTYAKQHPDDPDISNNVRYILTIRWIVTT